MAAKSAANPDKKLVIMYIPNGIVRRQFFPGENEAELPDHLDRITSILMCALGRLDVARAITA